MADSLLELSRCPMALRVIRRTAWSVLVAALAALVTARAALLTLLSAALALLTAVVLIRLDLASA